MSSNIDIMIDEAAEIALKLGEIWTSSNVKQKEQLQKLVFPKGIIYDRKIGAVRTEKINSAFGLIPQLPRLSGGNEDGLPAGQAGTEPFLSEQSLLVQVEGLSAFRYRFCGINFSSLMQNKKGWQKPTFFVCALRLTSFERNAQ